MKPPPLILEERYKLRDMLAEISEILEKPPFYAVNLEALAKWLRVPGQRWPSAALLSNANRPDCPTARAPSRRFYKRVQKLYHAIFHEWGRDPHTILRFADEERIVVVADFDPYDPSSLQTQGDLQAPGDVLFLDGDNSPNMVLIMGRPDKVIHCGICGGPLYQTTWNRKYHYGRCREIAKKRRRAGK